MGKMSGNKDRIPPPSIPRPLSTSVTTVATEGKLNRKINKEMDKVEEHFTFSVSFTRAP